MSALTDSIRKRFIQVLEEVRDEHRDMRSNVKLAKKLRTAPPRISEWEAGKGNPTIEHIYYLCKEFDKSPAFIVLGKRTEDSVSTDELHNVQQRIERIESALGKKRVSGVRKG